MAAWNVCLGADLSQAGSRELCCQPACPCSSTAARATRPERWLVPRVATLSPRFGGDAAMGGRVPCLHCSCSSLSVAWLLPPTALGSLSICSTERERNATREKLKRGACLWCLEAPCGWGLLSLSGFGELLKGLYCTHRTLEHPLGRYWRLLQAGFWVALLWPGDQSSICSCCCWSLHGVLQSGGHPHVGVYLTNPSQLQARGGSSGGTEGSAVHLNWDANICFTITGASSLYGGIWLAPGTLSLPPVDNRPCAGWTETPLAPYDTPNCHLLCKHTLGHLATTVFPGVCHKGRWDLQDGWAWAAPSSVGTDGGCIGGCRGKAIGARAPISCCMLPSPPQPLGCNILACQAQAVRSCVQLPSLSSTSRLS